MCPIKRTKVSPTQLLTNTINNSFRDGVLKITGTDIDVILPAVSRFGGGNRAMKKKRVIDRLMAYFEKYLELVSGIVSD